MGRTHLFLSLMAAMAYVLMGPVGATDHIVGGNLGWCIPSYHSYYQDWAKSRTFVVGDRLVFRFSSELHNVLEVSKKDFYACTENSVYEMYFNGPVIIELTETGDHYYFSGVGTHCEDGQKLSVTVTDSSGSSGKPVGSETISDGSYGH